MAAVIGFSRHSESDSGILSYAGTDSLQQNTYLMQDGDTLDSIVNVPEGTYLVVKSDQSDHDANVQVTGNGGFSVEKGAVLVLENVNLSGDGQERSTPVFAVYGDMVMNDGAVENFSGADSGFASDYGKGGVSAICVVDGTFTMNGGVISGNSSTTTEEIAFGGALRAEGKNAAVIINDGTISGNSVLSSATVPDDSTVTANALGGAIAVTEGASVTMNGGEISDNTAGSHDADVNGADDAVSSGNGGAIAVYSSDSDAVSSLYLNGGSITNNNAYRTGADQGVTASEKNETHGGGIFSNVYTKAVLNAGRIAGNTSDDKGGGVFLDSDRSCGGALFKNTLVSGNEARTLGGGLWFCPDGEADMFSEAKADGIAVFDNTTTSRGTDGAGDDLYVSPRSGDTGVTVTGTMPGGGSNAWYQDGGAGTQKTSNSSIRYATSDSEESVTLLQASAMINLPSSQAKDNAVKSATIVITGNHAMYGGGIGSNHYLCFGTPTSEEKEERNVPSAATEPEKISVNVNKVWVGKEGTSATVHLLANGTEVVSATLNADNNWGYTFTNLDKADSNGKDITYTLTEDAIDGYTSEVSGDAENGFTVTNTQDEPEKISIPVTKEWIGEEGTSATVHLLANGTEAANATLTAENDWTYTFTDLAEVDSDGNAITYTLTEDAVTGYTSEVSGDAESGFTVTNTQKKISIPVTKEWIGEEGTSATVHLLANGTEAASATLTAENDWTYTFTDLAEVDSDGNAITYTLTEDAITGYTSEVSGDAESGFTVTNTQKKISIPVTKVWDGDSGNSATVHLLANGMEVSSATLTADNNWTYTFTDLAEADSSGNAITYTLTEDAITGYTSEVSGDAESGFTVTNTQKKISIPVTKVWDGDAGSSATVHLLANGMEVSSATLTADNNWTYTFTDLAEADSSGNAITYTLTEDAVTGYTSEVSGDAESGFIVTNTETVNVHVSKIWSQGIEDSVTIRLIKNGELTDQTLVLTADTNWEGRFEDLPKYDSAGNKITYYVSEDNMVYYNYTVIEKSEYDFTVFNSYGASG